MQKPFNAINGLEALEMVVQDIKNQLSRDGRFRQNLTYHQLSYAVRINVNTYPADAGSFTEAVSGSVGRLPAGLSLEMPPVPLPQDAQSQGHIYHPPTADVSPRVEPVRQELSDDQILRLAQSRGLVATNEASVLDRGPRVQPVVPAVDDPSEVVIDERPNPRTLSEAPRSAGGQGEVITGGASEPPAGVLEIGRRHRLAHEEQLRVENARAGLSATVEVERTVVNPNAARREAGLPVPSPTRVAGSVVDLPTPVPTTDNQF